MWRKRCLGETENGKKAIRDQGGNLRGGAFQGKRDDLERKCYSRDGYQGIFRAGRQGGIRDKERYKDGRYRSLLGDSWEI